MASDRHIETQFASCRDALRDPKGWLLDALPWRLRRRYLARGLGETPPDECRLIGLRRPPERVFRAFRRIHGID